jgi:DNA-binding transcriptional ArsR family regulator
MQAQLLVLESPEQATAAIDPVRRRILEHLRDPDSAAGAARALGLPRQRLGYHIRELEQIGLLESVGERKTRNYVERLLQATARRYVISPSVLPGGALPTESAGDRFSSEHLVAAAARTVQHVGTLQRVARQANKPLPTLTIETEVRFASPDASHAFATELARAVARLVAQYHDDETPHGRRFRVMAAAHPALLTAGTSASATASPAQASRPSGAGRSR